jgi:hypothetical protein
LCWRREGERGSGLLMVVEIKERALQHWFESRCGSLDAKDMVDVAMGQHQ